MWEELVRARGGEIVATRADSVPPEAAFAALVLSDDGLLPLLARLDRAAPLFLLKSGRVGGGEGEAGSLAITEADATAALDAALAPGAGWELDLDLGADLLVSGAEGVAEELLIPRFLYRRADRIYDYAAAMPELLASHSWLEPPPRQARSPE